MKRILLPLLLLSVSAIAAAQPKPHIVDKAHSQINFVAEARLLTAHGFFDKWEADIQLDAAKIENSTFKITIDATSINTRNERRDNHLKSNDFFGVAQYPQIVLVSKKITKTADKKYTITARSHAAWRYKANRSSFDAGLLRQQSRPVPCEIRDQSQRLRHQLQFQHEPDPGYRRSPGGHQRPGQGSSGQSCSAETTKTELEEGAEC